MKQYQRLYQNYRSAYMQLVVTYYMDYQRQVRQQKNRDKNKLADLRKKILKTLDKMDENIPDEIIPIQSEELHYQVARIYGDLSKKDYMKPIMEKLVNRRNGSPLNRVEYANTFYKELNDTEQALGILEDMKVNFLQMEEMVKTRGFSNETVTKGEWSRWQKAYPEIVSSLVFIYKENNRYTDAELILFDWVGRNPNDHNAKILLNEIRK